MIAADEIQRNSFEFGETPAKTKRSRTCQLEDVNSPKTCFDYVGIIKSGAKYSVYKVITRELEVIVWKEQTTLRP